MKTILRTMLKENYGTVGEETNIVDKNGNKLHIGDIVNFVKTFEFKKNKTPTHIYCQSVVVKSEELTKAFLMGLEQGFNEDGTYEDDLELELVKSYKDISVGSGYLIAETIFLYERTSDEE